MDFMVVSLKMCDRKCAFSFFVAPKYVKMHLLSGLSPGPCWGSLQRFPDPLVGPSSISKNMLCSHDLHLFGHGKVMDNPVLKSGQSGNVCCD